ncbi:MAG: CRTAC1 family protein [Planctomycetota bacterium]|nr:MAG: CRTAC1 family protein [Planctomycetota bacterium]
MTFSPPGTRRLLAAGLAILLTGCGGGGPEATTGTPAGPPLVGRPTPPIPPDDPDQDFFVDATADSGLDFVHRLGDGRMDNILESIGAGGCLFDYDGDGRLDVYLVASAWKQGISRGPRPEPPMRNRLYRNLGDLRFADVTERAGVGDEGFGFSAAAADFDGDGDTDLFVANHGPNRLYRNRGDGTFEEVGGRLGLTGEACTVQGVFFDADGDGRLDLYEANYLEYDPDYTAHYAPDVFPGPLAYAAQPDRLWLQQPDGSFRDATADSGLNVPPGRAMGVSTADFDGDGRLDLFVANDGTPNFLFLAEGGGRFREAALEAGVAFGVHGEATAAMAGAVGDFDGDGLPDLSVTDTAYGSLYRNLGGGLFEDRVIAAGVAAASAQRVSWGGGFLDFDLDGDLDLYLANGDLHHPTGRADLLLANDGGSFTDVSPTAGAWFRTELLSRGGLIGDLDDDGAPDLVITCIEDRAVLLHNRVVGGDRSWIGFQLQAASPPREAYGARVEVVADGRSRSRTCRPACSYLGQGDPRLCFGLGSAASVDSVRVVWPDGRVESFPGLTPGRYHLLVEGRGEAGE